jgi:hypothetical protein
MTGPIRESGEKIEYEEMRLWEPNHALYLLTIMISYDFLKQMLPQPEMFELRQVLAIPKEDIEARLHAFCNKR